jgi:hypothetical protein
MRVKTLLAQRTLSLNIRPKHPHGLNRVSMTVKTRKQAVKWLSYQLLHDSKSSAFVESFPVVTKVCNIHHIYTTYIGYSALWQEQSMFAIQKRALFL